MPWNLASRDPCLSPTGRGGRRPRRQVSSCLVEALGQICFPTAAAAAVSPRPRSGRGSARAGLAPPSPSPPSAHRCPDLCSQVLSGTRVPTQGLPFFGRGSGRIASPAQRERPPTEGRRERVRSRRPGAPLTQPPVGSSLPRSLFAGPERDSRPDTGAPILRPRQRPYRLARAAGEGLRAQAWRPPHPAPRRLIVTQIFVRRS
jgi:hypothetical protein